MYELEAFFNFPTKSIYAFIYLFIYLLLLFLDLATGERSGESDILQN